MLTIPNLLSFLRFPLAFLFLYDNPFTRAITICLAAATDFLDGYIARNYQTSSRIGTVLDPIADKFFVMTALFALFNSGQITTWEISMVLCRDFSVILFGIYLVLSKNFGKYHFRSIWSGKLSTTCQLVLLILLTFQIPIPLEVYSIFVILGISALVELYLSDHTFIPPELKKERKI